MREFDFRNSLLKTISSYAPGEQPTGSGWVKLNTNENPFAPSSRIFDYLNHASSFSEALKRYPHPYGEPLRQTVAEDLQIGSDQIFIGNGSDDVLRLVFQAFLEEGEAIGVSEVTYSLYHVLANQVKGGILETPSVQDPENPFQANLQALAESAAKIIFLPNPNAQTGELFNREVLLGMIRASDKLWVIDEAYIDFAAPARAEELISRHTLIAEAVKLQNLIVTRTFSKSYSLAGLRIGFAVAHKKIISALCAIKDSYNVNTFAARLGQIAWLDREYFCECVNEILKQRDALFIALKNLGFKVLLSHANFLLVKPPQKITAEQLYLSLKEKKILIRFFKKSVFEDYVRISVGSASENGLLLTAIKDSLNG